MLCNSQTFRPVSRHRNRPLASADDKGSVGTHLQCPVRKSQVAFCLIIVAFILLDADGKQKPSLITVSLYFEGRQQELAWASLQLRRQQISYTCPFCWPAAALCCAEDYNFA